MSPAAPLSVPVPRLVFDPPSGPPALEKPVAVHLGAVRYADSRPLGADDARVVGMFVFRGAPGAEQVWDEAAKVWRAVAVTPAALAALTPIPFMPAGPEAPDPWTGMLVAAGQKDASGGDRFAPAVGGVPRYRLRAFATGERDGQTFVGLGAPSGDLLFTSVADSQRFVVELDPKDPATATTVRLILKNAARARAGYIEIDASGGQVLEIANCTASGSVLARIRLTAAGDIRLEPGPSGQIVLDGPLEAERITYRPSGGGGRQTL